ncbi:MAG: cytochrome c maturation protein CcmE [Allosphingosinicella sp.]|uniref:cytochrome c maturation protein CcmE n=1 Tax=Allosphingosinicella sp. TaxID=2823234 RepID=UPI00393736DD
MKPKSQRLILVSLAVIALIVAALLAMSAMREQAAFFYAPADVQRLGLPLDRAVRVGGMVQEGSLRRHQDGVTIDFVVHDETEHTIPVTFTGIVPNLFREGSGVVAEGRFQPDGRFVASEILAKHDENYMPPELSDRGLHKTETIE